MISVDVIPEHLQNIECQIRIRQTQLKKNMADQWDLQQQEGRIRTELTRLENDKYRLLTGRNI